MNVRALTRVRYAGRTYLPGESFAMATDHARTFELLQRVEPMKDEPVLVAAPTTYETRELTPETSSAETVDTKPRKRGRPRKGEYNRRDMTAEE